MDSPPNDVIWMLGTRPVPRASSTRITGVSSEFISSRINARLIFSLPCSMSLSLSPFLRSLQHRGIQKASSTTINPPPAAPAMAGVDKRVPLSSEEDVSEPPSVDPCPRSSSPKIGEGVGEQPTSAAEQLVGDAVGDTVGDVGEAEGS